TAVPRGIAVQSDGRIVVGLSPEVSGTSDVVRLTSTGAPDPTYGVVGFANGFPEDIADIAIGSAGKVVVVGNRVVSSVLYQSVRQLTTNGNDDPTFNGGDPMLFTVGEADTATAVGIQQPNSKIIVAGTSSFSGVDECTVARVFSTGGLDASFDGDGRQHT